MTYKTTNFEIECYYLNYYLGIPNGVCEDYWLDNSDSHYINWEAITTHNDNGIKKVDAFIKDISLWIAYDYDIDDLQQKHIDKLIRDFNGNESSYSQKVSGTFKISTIVDKEWQINSLFTMQEGGFLMPKLLEINFMDKEIKVL